MRSEGKGLTVIRRLLNLATILSLLVCVAVIALWVRSYSRRLGIVTWNPKGGRVVAVEYGGVYYQYGSYVQRRKFEWQGLSAPPATVRLYDFAKHRFAGFYFLADDRKGVADRLGPGHWVVGVALWFCLALAGVLPAIRIWRLTRRRQRLSAGLCPTCGYDLRATPGRCPECGTMPSSASAQ